VPVAASWVLETNVVERSEPPNDTLAPLTKALPEIVSEMGPTENCNGETLEICGTGFQSVTTLELVTDWFDVSAASMVTVFAVGTVAGAVYFPVVSMVPVVVLPPITPLTVQVRGAVDEAVNFCVAPARTFAALGDIVRAAGGGCDDPPGEVAQFEVKNAQATTIGTSSVEGRTIASQFGQE
jgi:hypothetical protein